LILLVLFLAIKGGTLIICPASLISQWQNELKTKVRPGILNVVQHYGPNRETSARKLARKDIVITTYHVVMWDLKSHPNTVSNEFHTIEIIINITLFYRILFFK